MGKKIQIFDALSTEISGMNLIEASAGTGKTYSMALIVLRLIIEKHVPLEKILVVTFTKAATAEIKRRIFTFIKNAINFWNGVIISDNNIKAIVEKAKKSDKGKKLLEDAIFMFDEASIYTIHGCCQRMLYEYSFESGFSYDLEIVAKDSFIIREIIYDFWRKHIVKYIQKSNLIDTFYNLSEIYLNKLLLSPVYDFQYSSINHEDKNIIKLKEDFYRYLTKQLPEKKRKAGVLFFDDLLRSLYDVLQSDKGNDLREAIASKYTAALIDEFQDTDKMQYLIFNDIFGNQNHYFYLIGDPKQSIYNFRGADIFSYINVHNGINDDNRYCLTKNYRSNKELVEAFNVIFGKTDSPFVYDEAIPYIDISATEDIPALIIDNEKEPSCVVWYYDKEINKGEAKELISKSVASEIFRLLNIASEGKAYFGTIGTIKNKLMPHDIAVLVNAKHEGESVKSSLTKYGINSTITSLSSVFESIEAKEILILLYAVIERSQSKIKNALLTPFFNYTLTEISRLDNNELIMADIVDDFYYFNSIWKEKGFIFMFFALLHKYDVKTKILQRDDGERKLTNILHIAEILHRESIEKFQSHDELILDLEEKISSKKQIEDYELRLESEDMAVKIVTIHKSKGLEYPVVFYPFPWKDSNIKNKKEYMFYHEDNQEKMIFNNDPAIEEISKQEQYAENMRVFYVAMTRAKNKCYTLWGLLNKKNKPMQDTAGHKFLNDAQNRFSNHCDLIEVKDLPDAVHGYYKDKSKKQEPKIKEFTGKIERNWMIASYSSIVSGKKNFPIDENMKFDETDYMQTDVNRDEYEILPKGKRTGLFIHEIFENIDYTKPQGNNFLNKIVMSHYPHIANNDDFINMLNKLIQRVLSTNLIDDKFSLSLLKKENRINEMEFFFKINRLRQNKLKEYFVKLREKDFENEDIKIDFKWYEIQGFMKGYIDLIFEYNNKYYIADWKTNYLPDYSPLFLKKEIIESNYDIQYMIYLAALHMYLSKNLLSYDFEKHFGGIFYLFVRGIKPKSNNNNGVFYFKPENNDIIELIKLFEG